MSGNVCSDKCIISLDVGTTTLKCFIYNNRAQILGSSSKKIELLESHQGWFELDEDLIFKQSVHVIREALANANLKSDCIDCLGITTQRNTFITWDRDTGVPFHHLITWQDLRAQKYVNEWNNCLKLKLFNGIFKFLHLVTRNKRFLAAAKLKFKSAQVVMRLKWMLDNNQRLKERVSEGKVLFGTLDTWLLWKLSGEKMHATDYSNASSTALFDPFEMTWSNVICRFVGIPMHILPPILDTSGYFGCCDQKLFGARIPIRALVADQQSSMFGQCCFKPGDLKCTLGTGTFIDCNTGEVPHTSMHGLYPLVGWKVGRECAYVVEGFASNTGQSLEWAKAIGLINKFEECDEMSMKSLATRSEPLDLCFVSAFNGFQAPVNDDSAAALMIGMTLGTTREDIVRAIVDSIAFRFHLLLSCLQEETRGKEQSNVILCDGGVSKVTYLLRLMNQLTGKCIERSTNVDSTSLGAAYLAGLASGIWKNKEELMKLQDQIETRASTHFTEESEGGVGECRDFKKLLEAEESKDCLPHSSDVRVFAEYEKWLEAVGRCKHWRL